MSKHRETAASVPLRGEIISFNISPKGHIEGALVETKTGIAQVNFHKHDGQSLARSMPVGSSIDLKVSIENEEGPHPVFVVDDEEAEATGTVVRLNYALHGDVNGYHLDDGTFVHVRPKGAKKYQMLVGEMVKATGSRHPGTDAVVLEAHAVERVQKHEVQGIEV